MSERYIVLRPNDEGDIEESPLGALYECSRCYALTLRPPRIPVSAGVAFRFSASSTELPLALALQRREGQRKVSDAVLYQSKPTQVEAVQWCGGNVEDVVRFGGGKVTVGARSNECILLEGKDGAQGWVPVPVRHWIVRPPGDLSDMWTVDPAYFAAKYDIAPPSFSERFGVVGTGSNGGTE